MARQPKVHVRSGPFSARTKRGTTRFNPSGRPMRCGRNPHKVLWDGGPIAACRMFVGFNVGDKPVYNISQLRDLTLSVREKQKNEKGEPVSVNTSFVIQKGTYRHTPSEGQPIDYGVIKEDGAQVVFFNAPGDGGENAVSFKENMRQLAGFIARDMRQKEVIIEFSYGNVAHLTEGVGWEEAEHEYPPAAVLPVVATEAVQSKKSWGSKPKVERVQTVRSMA